MFYDCHTGRLNGELVYPVKISTSTHRFVHTMAYSRLMQRNSQNKLVGMTIRSFLRDLTARGTELYHYARQVENAAKILGDHKFGPEFPSIRRNMTYWSCKNGIICIDHDNFGFIEYESDAYKELQQQADFEGTVKYLNGTFSVEIMEMFQYEIIPALTRGEDCREFVYKLLEFAPALRTVLATQRMCSEVGTPPGPHPMGCSSGETDLDPEDMYEDDTDDCDEETEDEGNAALRIYSDAFPNRVSEIRTKLGVNDSEDESSGEDNYQKGHKGGGGGGGGKGYEKKRTESKSTTSKNRKRKSTGKSNGRKKARSDSVGGSADKKAKRFKKHMKCDRRGDAFFYCASTGRTYFPIGTYDHEHLMTFMNGRSGTGKTSLLVCRISHEMFEDVAIMGDSLEAQYALAQVKDNTRVYMFMDVRKLRLPVGTFLSMVGGDAVEVTEKFKTARSVEKITAHCFMGGNVFPPEEWTNDPEMAILRRVQEIYNFIKPKKEDSSIVERLKNDESPNVLVIYAICYYIMRLMLKKGWKTEQFPSKFMMDRRDTFHKRTDPWYAFVKNRDYIELEMDNGISKMRSGSSESKDEGDSDVDSEPEDDTSVAPRSKYYELFSRVRNHFRLFYKENCSSKDPPVNILTEEGCCVAFHYVNVSITETEEAREYPIGSGSIIKTKWVDGLRIITNKY